MKAYIVWNENRTEGFITTDYQLAYEVRKGSETNCFNAEGKFSRVGATFCDVFNEDNCTIEELEL